jgi:hypothetical protein
VQSLERRRRRRTGYRRSNTGRADEASSREYAPQKPDRPHTRASVPLWTVISEACPPTISVLAEGGTGMCCLQCVGEIVRLTRRASSSSILIRSAKEGRRTTDGNNIRQETDGHHNGHHYRQNVESFEIFGPRSKP